MKAAVSVIEDVLARLRGYDTLTEELLRLSEQKNCIHEMSDCISRRMNLNAGIMDTGFRWIALTRLSGPVQENNGPADLTNERTFLSEELLSEIEAYVHRRHVQIDVPYILTYARDLPASMSFPDPFISALQIPIRSDDHVIAILTLSAPDREMDSVDADMYRGVAHLFSLVLIRDQLTHPQP